MPYYSSSLAKQKKDRDWETRGVERRFGVLGHHLTGVGSACKAPGIIRVSYSSRESGPTPTSTPILRGGPTLNSHFERERLPKCDSQLPILRGGSQRTPLRKRAPKTEELKSAWVSYSSWESYSSRECEPPGVRAAGSASRRECEPPGVRAARSASRQECEAPGVRAGSASRRECEPGVRAAGSASRRECSSRPDPETAH